MAEIKKAIDDIKRDSIMRGIVIDIVDPKLEGRVKLLIPKIMVRFDPNNTKPSENVDNINKDLIKNKDLKDLVNLNVKSVNYIWARPKSLNNYEVPYENQVVYCWFEDGDPQKCYYDYSSPTLNSEVTTFKNVKSAKSKLSKETRPNIKIFYESPKTFVIHYFDENPASKRYAITFDNGHSISINENLDENNIELITESKHIVRLDQKNEHILIKTHSGHFIVLHDKEKHITVRTVGGHTMKMNDPSTDITITASTGDKCYLGNDLVQLTSKSGDIVKGGGGMTQMKASSGGTVTCSGGNVSLN